MVVEGYKLYLDFHRNLWRLYTGAYNPATDYTVVPTGQAPDHRESQRGKEVEERLVILTNNSFSDLGTNLLR